VADDLVRRLRRWTAASWALPAGPPRPTRPTGGLAGSGGSAAAGGAATRAEAAAAAVQRIADLGAAAEGRPPRPVPRLADTVLADQLAVVVDDVLRTGDRDAAHAVAAELAALRRALLGRH